MDFDPQTMSLNDYAHARASAHCAFVRLLRQGEGAVHALLAAFAAFWNGIYNVSASKRLPFSLVLWCFEG